jgi:hypothetical protein
MVLMSTNIEAPVSPDLSSLTPRQRLNIAVARVQYEETRWKKYGSGWQLWAGSKFIVYVGDGYLNAVRLPDYAGDPSAWGALMEKEGVWAYPVYDVDGTVLKGWHGCTLKAPFGGSVGGLWETPGKAVSIATLSKYGIDPTPYIGV